MAWGLYGAGNLINRFTAMSSGKPFAGNQVESTS
jgi:hypothetical protein